MSRGVFYFTDKDLAEALDAYEREVMENPDRNKANIGREHLEYMRGSVLTVLYSHAGDKHLHNKPEK